MFDGTIGSSRASLYEAIWEDTKVAHGWRTALAIFAMVPLAQCGKAESVQPREVVNVNAVENHVGETRSVRGFAYASLDADGGFRAAVCESMSTETPPVCSGRSVVLRRVPDNGSLEARVGRLHRHGNVTWSSERIQITGAINRDGVDVVLDID